MGLFSKKPGGTTFGNLLRTYVNVVQKAAGIPPILGQGKHMIPLPSQHQQQVHVLQQNQEAIQQVYGQTSTNGSLESIAPGIPQIDLGKYIKLPTIDTNNALDTKNIVLIGITVLGVGWLLKKL